MTFFNHYIVADPACREGEVRLFNNQSSDGVVMGQVELCRTPGFRTKVCDTGWDDHDAEVVCRELGLPSGKCSRLKAIIFVIVQPWLCICVLQQVLVQQGDVCLEKE